MSKVSKNHKCKSLCDFSVRAAFRQKRNACFACILYVLILKNIHEYLNNNLEQVNWNQCNSIVSYFVGCYFILKVEKDLICPDFIRFLNIILKGVCKLFISTAFSYIIFIANSFLIYLKLKTVQEH